jgi:hypothetical protein
MRFSAHSVGQHIQLQRGVDRVAIFIVFSDAPKVGARAGFDVQKGPHSAGGEVPDFLKFKAIAPPNPHHFETR